MPLKADMCGATRDVRYGPIADIATYLVSEQLHRVGDREPERLGSSEIDDQLELGWLLDRHVAGLLAPENPGNVNAGTAIRVCLARSIAQKAASRDILAFRVA